MLCGFREHVAERGQFINRCLFFHIQLSKPRMTSLALFLMLPSGPALSPEYQPPFRANCFCQNFCLCDFKSLVSDYGFIFFLNYLQSVPFPGTFHGFPARQRIFFRAHEPICHRHCHSGASSSHTSCGSSCFNALFWAELLFAPPPPPRRLAFACLALSVRSRLSAALTVASLTSSIPSSSKVRAPRYPSAPSMFCTSKVCASRDSSASSVCRSSRVCTAGSRQISESSRRLRPEIRSVIVGGLILAVPLGLYLG